MKKLLSVSIILLLLGGVGQALAEGGPVWVEAPVQPTQEWGYSETVFAHPNLPSGTLLSIAGPTDADVCINGGGTVPGPTGLDWDCEYIKLNGAKAPVQYLLRFTGPVRVEGARWAYFSLDGKTWEPIQRWNP